MIGKTSFSNSEPALFLCLNSNRTYTTYSTYSSRQLPRPRRKLPSMTAPIRVRIFRTFLALTVSLWMAGAGCMLGCGNTGIAAVHSLNSQTIIAGPSCHHATHDCCAKKNSSSTEKKSQQISLLSAVPEPVMGECPLAVNATAVTASKATHPIPEQARTLRTEPDGLESITQHVDWSPRPVRFLNRAPTYLLCCVFLI